MNSRAVFGLSALMSFLVYVLGTARSIMPRLRMPRWNDALVAVVVPPRIPVHGTQVLHYASSVVVNSATHCHNEWTSRKRPHQPTRP
jgi:hypothetical protein